MPLPGKPWSLPRAGLAKFSKSFVFQECPEESSLVHPIPRADSSVSLPEEGTILVVLSFLAGALVKLLVSGVAMPGLVCGHKAAIIGSCAYLNVGLVVFLLLFFILSIAII